ncbi:MAG: zinc-binding alcohol dehydrogenase family protein [Flavobacteriales bacterium]
MKAVFIASYGSAENSLRLQETKDPVALPGEVLIQTEAFGINFADVMARKGLYNAAPKPPFIPGYEICGKVIATGLPEDAHWIGKRVASFTRFGGYAEKCVAPVQALITLQHNISASDACALCTQYATAWFAVNESVVIREGETALIYAAAGGVGTAIVQLLKLKNVHVTSVVSSEKKEKVAIENGSDVCIIASNFAEIKSRLSGKTFDVIFNPVYGKTLKHDIRLLKPAGRLVLYGASSRLSRGRGFFNTLFYALAAGRIFPVFLMMQSKTLSGINMLEIGDRKPELLKQCMENVFQLYYAGKLKPAVHEFPVTEIARVHREMEERKTTGKLVIRW